MVWKVHGEIELLGVRHDRAVAVVAQLSGTMREHGWGSVHTDGGVIVLDYNAVDANSYSDAHERAVMTIDSALDHLGIHSSERRWKDVLPTLD